MSGGLLEARGRRRCSVGRGREPCPRRRGLDSGVLPAALAVHDDAFLRHRHVAASRGLAGRPPFDHLDRVLLRFHHQGTSPIALAGGYA